jgi:homoserine O-acetyltransferase/O-succinyltransferase
MTDVEIFEAPDFTLQRGGALPMARLVYKTLGTLSPSRDNVVLIPSWPGRTARSRPIAISSC